MKKTSVYSIGQWALLLIGIIVLITQGEGFNTYLAASMILGFMGLVESTDKTNKENK